MNSAFFRTLAADRPPRRRPSRGRVRVPGDKSISHRALILGALTVGETADHRPARRRGRAQHRQRHARARRQGRARRRAAPGAFTASASAASPSRRRRSISAIPAPAAGWSWARSPAARSRATFDGDASLRKRPMRRMLDPLEQMGARALGRRDGGRLPLTLQGARDPMPIVYRVAGAVGAAQVGGAARRPCRAGRDHGDREAKRRRDHTERMLKHFGAKITGRSRIGEHGRRITLQGQPELDAGAGRRAGRSVLGGVSAGGGADRAGLGDRCSTA